MQVVVLLGTDTDSPNVGRTDSILLAFLQTHRGAVSLVSIPRDLYVYLPGSGMGRLNTVFALGGFELLSDTLEYNLGVRPHHWVLAHMDDFVHLVDDLGGIEVLVAQALPTDCGIVPAGLIHMNGEWTLCYVRERNSTSDIARSWRQQEVLWIIFQRMMSLDALPQLPEWYQRYSSTVQTDLALADLLSLAPLALHVYQGGSLHHFQIGWDEVVGWQVPETGAQVLLPDRERVFALIRRAVDVLQSSAPLAPEEEPPVPLTEVTETPFSEPDMIENEDEPAVQEP